jgi:rhodanese-related sulfurtransferase
VKFRAARQTLVLLALALLPAVGQGIYLRDKVSWQSSVPASESVTMTEARQWGGDVLWVDARPDEEFARDHVPGAVSLNEDRWDELFPQFLQKWSEAPDKKVVVYCSTQSCNLAEEVARRLRGSTQPPMQSVFVLKGGWEEWLRTKK